MKQQLCIYGSAARIEILGVVYFTYFDQYCYDCYTISSLLDGKATYVYYP